MTALLERPTTETPRDIDRYTVQEALDLCETSVPGVPPKPVRFKVISTCYNVLGYELTSDIVMMLVSEVLHKQVMAVAGSGKTTNSQLWILTRKLWHYQATKEKLDGDEVLCVVYNRHNVAPMKTAHINIVRKLKSSISGLHVDDRIRAVTMHEFCLSWMREYPIHSQLPDNDPLSEMESEEIFRTIATNIMQLPEDRLTTIDFRKLFAARNLYVESLENLENEELKFRIGEAKVSIEEFLILCKGYESVKSRRGRIDFTDMLVRTIKMMEEYPAVRERIQDYYKYFVADEIQDFTPLMLKLFRLIVGDGQALLIGDIDQTIYDFKGADVTLSLRFSEIFEGGKVYTLIKNRRCSSKIVEAATKIIEMNKNRFDTKIIPAREGGKVDLIPYSTDEGQVKSIVKQVASMSREEQDKVAIIYRNTEQSQLLVNELEKEGIPFNLVSGVPPFGHDVFKEVLSVLNCLANPYVKSLQLNLYRALPISRDECDKALGYDRKTRSFANPDKFHFTAIDFGAFENRKSFSDSKKILARISKGMKTTSMKAYFPYLFKIFRDNHWNYKSHMKTKGRSDQEAINDYFLQETYNFFMREEPFDLVYQEYTKRLDTFKRNTERHVGVTVSTFHGVKGREFDKVFLTFLDDSIVPSYGRSYESALDIGSMLEEDAPVSGDIPESETRLFYMALTRARYENYLYYNVSNPSQYVRVLMSYYENQKTLSENSIAVAEAGSFSEIETVQTSSPTMDIKTPGPTSANEPPKTTGYLDKLFKGL